jgi:hypothetical protein
MSVPVVTVPGVEDLAELAAAAAEFAATADLTIVPAVPEREYGPEVCLGPGTLDLPGFLALAGRLGGGVLYLRAVPFDPGSDQPGDPPVHLVRHKGQTGQVSIAFAVNGLVHFWEHRTAWYEEWQDLADSQPALQGHVTNEADEADEAERLSSEDRARLAGELADAILADRQFRAAPRSDRQRLARLAIPAGSDNWAGYDAVRAACDRAQEMTGAAYEQITGRLDDLAAEFLASPAYQQASSAAGRKEAVVQFLIPRADGFSPPTLIRDELHARAQRLARKPKGAGAGLF